MLKHKKFDYKNPNKVRSILGSFQKNNIELFHSIDGTGYNFISKEVIKIDKINPQISARVVIPMTQFSNFNLKRKRLIHKYLQKIVKSKPSKDLYEIISKAMS